MHSLVIPAVHLRTLRDHLLQADEMERFAYAFCTRSSDDRLLVADVVPVPDGAMRVQSTGSCRPALAFEREQLETCLSQGYQPLLLHSHPFTDEAGFSGIDIAAMADYRDWLQSLYPEATLAFGVIGRRNLEATVSEPGLDRMADLPIAVTGNWTLDTPLSTTDRDAEIDPDLYDRSIRLVTEAGQQRLAATTVAVVGAGGLGFLLIKELAHLGVGKLVVIDPDYIERSNLARLVGASTWDIGRPKVTVLAQHLHATGLDVEVEPVCERVEDAEEALASCDIVIGTADQVTARSFLNQVCVRDLRYYIDAGTVIRTDDDRITAIEGIVQLVAPGANACYACLDRADPERARRERLSDAELEEEVEEGYIEASALAPEPAVVTLNGTVASQAATMVARLVTGYAPPPDMIRYDELATELQELTTRRDTACPTCGDDGLLAHGERDPRAGDVEAASQTRDLELALETDSAATGEDRPIMAIRHRLMKLMSSRQP